ncbi:MAG: homocysteine S-methyltransferase family protein [Verrucomicrobia bacterium]|nr:homocysteine S-methyltransferase family protein [Verrucomicrobiota bacterium]
MADFLTTLKSQPLLTDGAMGSYLFELTGRLSETNHVYESFNVEQPDLIRRVHRDYLAAGAQCLKANTFGANRHQLRQFGLEKRVAALNTAGVRLAREVGTEPVFVLASIGPTDEPLTEPAAVAECYREQIESLLAAGPDALLLETFSSQRQLELLIELLGSFPKTPPIIAETTCRPEVTPLAFVQRMAELGAAVAGVNCCSPWDASAFVDAAHDAPLPLVVMPNAGGFQRIGNRFMTSVNPEFIGKFARSLMDRGVRLIGGCCEVHPPHIREMHNYLRSRHAGITAGAVLAQTSRPPVGDAEKKQNGPFSRKLKDNEFVVSVEVLPPRGTDEKLHGNKIEFIRQLAESGLADSVDVTDGSRGIPLMSPGDFILLVRERLGWTAASGDRLELIPHFTGRDLNVMGVQSRLVGYHAHRVHNVLFITGDPPKMSPTYPRSTAVFDLDSVELVRLTHACLNAGVDFGGAPLGKQADPRTHFTIGTGFEPEATDMRREMDRLRQKLDNGADYIMTQPAFRPEPLDALRPFRSQNPILVGVMLLTSFEHARRVAQVPGVVLPDAILQRLAAAPNLADQAKIGREIAAEQIRWVRSEGWAGLYLMSPAGTAGVLDVLRVGLAS